MEKKNSTQANQIAYQGTRVPDCVYPQNVSCRGCSHSYQPDLFDGGCRLFYERLEKEQKGSDFSDGNP